MSLRAHRRPAPPSTRSSHRRRLPAAVLAVLGVVAAMLPAVASGVTVSAAAATNDLTIRPVNARSVLALVKGDPIPAGTHYTWLITSDDVGDPTQAVTDCVPGADGSSSPDPLRDNGSGQSVCQWPSIRTTPGNVPVIASGDQTTLSDTVPITLPDGKYLVSLLADGYALGGAHVRIPAAGPLDVPVQPYPLPLATMKIQVFHDNAPVDGTFEVDGESGTNLAGFTAHLSDVFGEVTTDWFGNPLCTNYVHTAPDAQHPQGQVQFDAEGSPVIDTANPGGACRSDATGLITVPNLGSNRYGVTVVKPADKVDWVQTTTLEGGHDHDVWLMPGDTGNDTEMVVGGEPVPWVQFGFIEQKALSGSASGEVKGQVLAGLTYVGGNGGITIPGGTGTAGGKEGAPIDRPWLALSDLGNGDQMVSVTRGAKDGTFDIPNVPDGTYQLTAWDDLQDYILFSSNVTVTGGQVVDTGKTYLSGWTARIYGTVFIDTNANGKRDPGEQGVPLTAVTLRERDNSLMDQFQNTVTTDRNGNYAFTEAYPLTKWLVLEHFNTRYEGTGITFQSENDPTPTTLRGNAVDVNVLPVLGLGGRVDWGVRPYAPGTNGGIVGTVTYDTTRNELDPAYAVTEGYQPGIPGVPVHLFPVLKDSAGNPVLDGRGLPQKDGAHELTAPYISETWAAPKGCTPRQWDGSSLGLAALPQGGNPPNYTCIESPADGHQVMPADNTDGAFAQTVNGNYGFATSDLNLYAVGEPKNPGYPDPLPDGFICPDDNANACAPGNHDLPLYATLADFGYEPQSLIPDDYVVTVDLPKDAFGQPIYQVTREEDVNVFSGDEYLPQENFPPSPDGAVGGGGVAATPLDPPEAPPSQGGGLGTFA